MNGVTSFRDAIECPEINTSSFLKKGTDIDMQSKKITNCAEGREEDDVVTIKGLNAYYRKGTALDLQSQRIKNLGNAIELTDCPNLGKVIAGINNMENYRIINVAAGISDTDACKVEQLKVHTHQITQDLQMNNNKITGLANGTAITDACTVGQANEHVLSKISDVIYRLKGRLARHNRSNVILITKTSQDTLLSNNNYEVLYSTGMFGPNRLVPKQSLSHPLFIPISFFVKSDTLLLSGAVKWNQEPVTFAKDSIYFIDTSVTTSNLNGYNNHEYVFYFIMLPPMTASYPFTSWSRE